jgi:hypothetical protein
VSVMHWSTLERFRARIFSVAAASWYRHSERRFVFSALNCIASCVSVKCARPLYTCDIASVCAVTVARGRLNQSVMYAV